MTRLLIKKPSIELREALEREDVQELLRSQETCISRVMVRLFSGFGFAAGTIITVLAFVLGTTTTV